MNEQRRSDESSAQGSSTKKPSGPSYDGKRVVGAMLGGVALGLLIALFLKNLIDNSPLMLPPRRLFWLFLLSAANGALVGLAIESMRQLQASNPDPAYHRRIRRKGKL